MDDHVKYSLYDMHGKEIKVGDTVKCEYLDGISRTIKTTVKVESYRDLPWSFNCSQKWEIIED